MDYRENWTYILILMILLGILAGAFFVVPFFFGQPAPSDMIDRTITSGIILAILLILVILIIGQRDLMERIRELRARAPAKGPGELRKELAKLYRDLGALKIVADDGLISKKDYEKKKSAIDAMIDKRKEELRVAERKARKGSPA